MSRLKALIIKDLQTNKKGLAVTVWIVLALYVLIIGSLIYATITNAGNLTCAGVPWDMLNKPDISSAISFSLQVGLLFGFLGFMFAIQMLSISASLLNSDVRHKCELFHRSQPVSFWQLTGSRFIAGVGGVIGLALLVGLLQYFVGNILLLILTPLKVDWWMSLNGVLLGWLHISVSLLVLGSIGFLLSAVFKDNSVGKGALVIGGIQAAVMILNYILRLDIPLPIVGLFKLITSNIGSFSDVFPTMQYGIQFGNNIKSVNDVSAFTLPPMFLTSLWSTLVTWGIALKLAVSGLLFVLAACIYQRREVQF